MIKKKYRKHAVNVILERMLSCLWVGNKAARIFILIALIILRVPASTIRYGGGEREGILIGQGKMRPFLIPMT